MTSSRNDDKWNKNYLRIYVIIIITQSLLYTIQKKNLIKYYGL